MFVEDEEKDCEFVAKTREGLEELGEISKKYEEYSKEEKLRHIQETSTSKETVTELDDAFFNRMPIFIFHKSDEERVVLLNRDGTTEKDCTLYDVGSTLRTTIFGPKPVPLPSNKKRCIES